MSKGSSVHRIIASRVAQHIVDETKQYAHMIDICGSLRRGRDMVSDIDIVALPAKGPGIPLLLKLELLGFKGNIRWTKSWPVPNGPVLKIEVNIANSVEEYGAQLLHHTGPYQFNIAIRGLAKSKGWKLSQYGLFDKGNRIAGESESEVLKMLGLRMIYPEERDDVDLKLFRWRWHEMD